MLIPLTNIIYDVEDAIEYYETVKKDHLDLMWTKAEMLDYLNPDKLMITTDMEKNLDFQHQMFLNAVGHKEPFISWTREQCLELSNKKFRELTENVKIWNIKYNNAVGDKMDRQKELQFGFAKKILDTFPDVDVFELIINPVGTKYHRHTDDGDSIRIIIPIIADEGAVWHFDDIQNVTHPPGNAYLLLKDHAHGTEVLGPNDRVTLHFLLDAKHTEWVKSFSCKL